MNPIAVFSSIQHELSRTQHFPMPVSICLKGLSSVHRIWWLCRKKQMVKPENIVPACLGSLLQGGLKFTPMIIEETVQAIGKLILIATRIDETIQRIQALTYAFNDLKNAFLNKFSSFIEPQWVENPKSFILSAHWINQWKTFSKTSVAYFRRLYFCLLDILAKIFKLSMQLWDTYHAFIYSHDAIPEIFVNSMYWFRKIRYNKEYIIEKLNQYQPFIQTVFDAIQASSSAEKLIDKTKNVLDVTVKAFEKVEDASNFIGTNITKGAKKALYTIKSHLLCNEFESLKAHTPFVLQKRPEIFWEGKPAFKNL